MSMFRIVVLFLACWCANMACFHALQWMILVPVPDFIQRGLTAGWAFGSMAFALRALSQDPAR